MKHWFHTKHWFTIIQVYHSLKYLTILKSYYIIIHENTLNISSFITLLVNNYEKEQKAMQMMENMQELKKMMENVEHGAKGITGTNKEEN